MKKTHWKKLDNPNYLGAYSLMVGDKTSELTAKINKVVNEEVRTAKGPVNCKVMYLQGCKPMILNTTNSKIIEKIYKTPYIEDWIGQKITIYVANINAFGEFIDCLRVRPSISKEPAKPELIANSDNYKKVISALKGGYKLAQIKGKYQISKETETLLKKEVTQ